MEQREEEDELPDLPSPKRYRTYGMSFRNINIPAPKGPPPDWDKDEEFGGEGEEEEENLSLAERQEEEGPRTSEVAAPAARKKPYDAEAMQRDLDELLEDYRVRGIDVMGGVGPDIGVGGTAPTTGVSKSSSRPPPMGGEGEEEDSEIERIAREVEEEIAEDKRREEEKREDKRRREEARRRAEGEGDVDELLEFAGNVGQAVIDRIPETW